MNHKEYWDLFQKEDQKIKDANSKIKDLVQEYLDSLPIQPGDKVNVTQSNRFGDTVTKGLFVNTLTMYNCVEPHYTFLKAKKDGTASKVPFLMYGVVDIKKLNP